MKCISGQPSWRIASRDVEAFVTELGGHLGPVTFSRRGRRIQPFAVAPWADEKLDRTTPALLRALRGDFFCMPFGGNEAPFRGERHPPHGETANGRWTFESLADGCLHLSLRTKVRPARVDKYLFVRPGHNAVYSRHIVSGLTGPMNFGHHATLRFPEPPGSGVISTSRFVFGQVPPTPFETPERGGYSALRPGATFRSLARVALGRGGFTDLRRYPARRGFEDLVMLVSDERQALAWTAVTFARQGYVWFALKDPRVLRATILWMSNGGRHYPPWNGRHVNVMGLEEVTSYFHYGLAESARRNPVAARGWATCRRFTPARPVTVNYIMAVAAVPRHFDRVVSIEPAPGRDAVILQASGGPSVQVPLNVSFLRATGGC